MGSTFTSLHYHIVFSTKERRALISNTFRTRLHEYLGGTVNGLKGVPEAIGGVADHVHLLVGLKTTHTVADFVRDLKKSSSMWIHDVLSKNLFSWQEGYGAFTVSPTSREAVARYIANQESHHHKTTFKEEFIALLEKSGIEYDPKYLW